jgi:hypothetical protein
MYFEIFGNSRIFGTTIKTICIIFRFYIKTFGRKFIAPKCGIHDWDIL